MTIIQNNELKINVSSHGAELQNIIKNETNQEYLWQGDPKFWNRRAPVLFPIVGALKDDEYEFDGVTYHMSKHGFARNEMFSLLSTSDTSCAFELVSNNDLSKIYPFSFRLIITYQLEGARLTVDYRIENNSTHALFYSIGGHPAFNCPLNKLERRSDYQLVFDQGETISTQKIGLSNGLRTGERQLILNNESTIELIDELFDEDALIFDGLKSKKVSLRKNDVDILQMEYGDFPYLGIWSKNRESPFICLEPWVGIADHQDHNKDFTKKEGIVKLESQAYCTFKYSITIF